MTTLRNLFASALLLCTVGLSAQPMNYDAMRDNARYLTDRMAHELAINAGLLDDLYCINYDYISGVNDYLDDVAVGYRLEDYNAVLAARDLALQRLLSPVQWTALMAIDYFFRPICFASRHWYFGIYHYLPFTGHWYFHAPTPYAHYRGGRFFGGMSSDRGHAPGYQSRRQGGATDRGRTTSASRSSSGRGSQASASRGNHSSSHSGNHSSSHGSGTGSGASQSTALTLHTATTGNTTLKGTLSTSGSSASLRGTSTSHATASHTSSGSTVNTSSPTSLSSNASSTRVSSRSTRSSSTASRSNSTASRSSSTASRSSSTASRSTRSGSKSSASRASGGSRTSGGSHSRGGNVRGASR